MTAVDQRREHVQPVDLPGAPIMITLCAAVLLVGLALVVGLVAVATRIPWTVQP